MKLTKEEKEFFDEVRLVAVDDEMIRAIQIIDRLITENNRLSVRCEELEVEKDIAESLSRFGNSLCGHSSQYAYTEDGGKHIICLLCRSKKVEEMEQQNGMLKTLLGDVRSEKLLKVVECAALQVNLSALLSAVGPIVELIPKELRGFTDIANNNYVNARIGDLRTLSTVAAGIKEGRSE